MRRFHPFGLKNLKWRTICFVFWSIALAVYDTANMEPKPFLAVILLNSNSIFKIDKVF